MILPHSARWVGRLALATSGKCCGRQGPPGEVFAGNRQSDCRQPRRKSGWLMPVLLQALVLQGLVLLSATAAFAQFGG
ncbi:MAG: hypothetical protein ACK5F7_10260, partial [Planctomycetaceae bacterium]